jgi:hypothetical protein
MSEYSRHRKQITVHLPPTEKQRRIAASSSKISETLEARALREFDSRLFDKILVYLAPENPILTIYP